LELNVEKNVSAAPARKGGKAKQDGPVAGDQATKDNQGAVDSQPVNAGFSADSSEATGQDQAGQQTSGSAATPATDTESARQVSQLATGGILPAAQHLVTGERIVGWPGPELELPATFPAKHVEIDLGVLRANLASLVVERSSPAADESSQGLASATTGDGQSNAAAPVSQSTHGLKVTSSQAGFRRAGRAWSTTPTVIALSELTDREVELLKGEPMLSVEQVRLEDEEA
jgi:hypothetical protein